MIIEWKRIFSQDDYDLGVAKTIKHAIQTESARPIKQSPYRRSPFEQDIIKKEVDKMITMGVIEPSYSPWASPVVLVNKKDGTTRFCVDYRKVNSITTKDNYPLPRIQDLVESLSKAKHFSTIDLQSGFWQIDVKEEDREKTAFVTKEGLYQFKKMPFGLCNAPGTFQRLMDRVLDHKHRSYALVYLDDINIYSQTLEDHLVHLRLVFEALEKEGLKIKPSKCEFFKESLDFLGFTILPKGVLPIENKVERISNLPPPTTVKEVRSFLGACNYYRHFIINFEHKSRPLVNLTTKTKAFIWTKECQEAFDSLKETLTKAPVLAYPDYDVEFRVYVDSSYEGIGAVLVQEQEDGSERPVHYISRGLNKHEKNYTVTEIECLGIIFVLKKLRPYLYGPKKFTIFTDHRALECLKPNPILSKRIQRWIIYMTQFNMDIRYIKGKENIIADFLSRYPGGSVNIKDVVGIPDKQVNHLFKTNDNNVSLELSTKRNPTIKKINGELLALVSDEQVLAGSGAFLTFMKILQEDKHILKITLEGFHQTLNIIFNKQEGCKPKASGEEDKRSTLLKLSFHLILLKNIFILLSTSNDNTCIPPKINILLKKLESLKELLGAYIQESSTKEEDKRIKEVPNHKPSKYNLRSRKEVQSNTNNKKTSEFIGRCNS